MPSKRPLTRIRDIVENGEAVLEYIRDMDLKAYQENRLVRDATERCFARISEAAVKLGPLAEELFPAHNWLAMRHFGNVLRHDYRGVLDTVIWNAATNPLPPLLDELASFLARYPEEQETL
ncbi:HepT-like ribonuclease domain-containing protein [Rhizobium sp. SIMBA_035]